MWCSSDTLMATAQKNPLNINIHQHVSAQMGVQLEHIYRLNINILKPSEREEEQMLY